MHLLMVNYSFIPAQMRGMQRDSICWLWWSEQRWAGGYFPFQRATQREVCPRFLPYIPSHWAWLGWIMQGLNPDVFAHTNIFPSVFCRPLKHTNTHKLWWEIGVRKPQIIYLKATVTLWTDIYFRYFIFWAFLYCIIKLQYSVTRNYWG